MKQFAPVRRWITEERNRVQKELVHSNFDGHGRPTRPDEFYPLGQTATTYRQNLLLSGEVDGDYTPENLRVVVPLSGGLDSVTAFEMARELDLDPVAIYLDWGQDFAEPEMEVARAFAPELTVLDEPIDFRVTVRGFIQVGRNPTFYHRIAFWMAEERGWFGELWTGVRGDEMHDVSGDKSIAFHVVTNAVMTDLYPEVLLTHPLRSLTKCDLVDWWVTRGRLDAALSTRTCFEAGPEHCGACWACFMRWSAFAGAGYRTEVELTMPCRFHDAHRSFIEKSRARDALGLPHNPRDPRQLEAMRSWPALAKTKGYT